MRLVIVPTPSSPSASSPQKLWANSLSVIGEVLAGRGNRSIGISVTRADFIDPQETEDRRGFNVFALRNREWKCSDAEQSVSEDGYEYDPYDKSP